MTMNPPSNAPQPTPVVTAFLVREGHVLLAKRGREVSTFPGHWAGISGYLEGDDPVWWSVVEVSEECDLSLSQLIFRNQGTTLIAAGPEEQSFAVHPLLFDLLPGTDPRADWEAERFQWVSAEDLLADKFQPAVPQLAEAFREVWPPPPLNKAWDANIRLIARSLREDRAMGASTLARTAVAHLVKLLSALEAGEPWAALPERLAQATETLSGARPAMLPLRNLMREVARLSSSEADCRELRDQLQALATRAEQNEQETARQASAAIPPGSRVITLSDSGTVRQTLLQAKDRVESVIVAEGRPLCEGRALAAWLAQQRIPVTLITDAQMDRAMADVSLVIFGADAVLPGRGAYNKVGSTLLALAAQRRSIPVWVMADSLKFAGDEDSWQVSPESNPPEEVWEDAPPGVDVRNDYFDFVSALLIDQVITEHGPRSLLRPTP